MEETNKKTLSLPENINISIEKQNFINDIIEYLSHFNEKLIYMYLEKENNKYIIYKCYHKTTEWDMKHFDLKDNYYIYFSLTYNLKYDNLILDIEVRDYNGKNVIMNTTSDFIYNMTLNYIINYYIGTLKQLNKSIKYVKSYDF